MPRWYVCGLPPITVWPCFACCLRRGAVEPAFGEGREGFGCGSDLLLIPLVRMGLHDEDADVRLGAAPRTPLADTRGAGSTT
jgi:hypothetical protein